MQLIAPPRPGARRPAGRPAVRARARGVGRGLAGGLALMEALVAVLLLSSCALAYAALQLRGLSAGSSSMWRSKATLLAYEMADRMRANRSAVAGAQYNSLTTPQVVTDCGSSSACSPARMAQLDYAQWSATLGRELPGGKGVVCLDATPDDGTAASPGCSGGGTVWAVKVFWSERGQPTRLAVGVRP